MPAAPLVTVVFLVYNRREELRESLERMLADAGDDGTVEFIVVDNASTDGSGAMVREEFGQVRVLTHERNVGVSGWNIGFAAARGDWVLALDDDCYLEPGGLRRAVEAGEEQGADLVSFRVVSTIDPTFEFSHDYPTGLFTFWGCAVLMRRHVIDALEGYDPDIFVWGNELEFMLRFFDRGLRHLHFPEVTAMHMKKLESGKAIGWKPYRVNAGRFAFIAAKRLHARDAAETLVALIATRVRDAVRMDPGALSAIPTVVADFVRGLRVREPVRNAELSRSYRRNFLSFASPWWFMPNRWDEYFERRRRFYPKGPGTLEF